MYQGNQPIVGRFAKLDNISSQFNSATTSFTLYSYSELVYPGTAQNLIISLDGVIQEPGVAFTVSGSLISFSEPVPTGTQFFGVLLGSTLNVGVPSDGSVGTAQLAPLNTLEFNQLTAAAISSGKARWNDSDGTLELGLKGGNVTLQIGQEQVQRVYNNTGATLANGRSVYITGAFGDRITVAYTNNTSEATSSKTFGMLTETIASGSEGYVTTHGLVRGLDTSSWLAGSQVWVSSTNGDVTAAKPVAPAHSVLVGYVVKQHVSTGIIFVHVQNGSELDELHDVLLTGKTNADVLQYDSSTGLWKNVQKGHGTDTVLNGWLAKDIGSIVVDKGTVSTGTVTFDYMGGSCQRLQVGGTLNIATSNFPPTGNLGVMQIELVNGGSAAVTFPTINWVLKTGAFTTVMSEYLTDTGRNALQSSGIDFIMLWTRNGGSTIYGKLL